MKKRIVYIYPVEHFVSFHIVAKRHIECLRKAGFEVVEVDENRFEKRYNDPVIIHPAYYILKRAGGYIAAPKLIGVDVIESNALSFEALSLFSRLDALLVPSRWSRYVANKMGLENVLVVRHWLPKRWERKRRDPQHSIIVWLKRAQEQEGWKGILYHLWHSGQRKGALEVLDAFMLLRARRPTGWKPVVKRMDIKDQLLGPFYTLDAFEIAEKLTEDDLIDLYDVVAAHVVAARAGGFELTALESIFRGTPTLAPSCGCFAEYAHLVTLPVGCEYGSIPVGREETIHVGIGWRIDPYDLVFKLELLLDDYKRYREVAERRMWEARREFSEERGCAQLVEAVEAVLRG